MITITLIGAESIIERFAAMPATVQARINQVLNQIGARFVAYVAQNKLSGQVLNRRTGTLRRSLHYVVSTAASSSSVKVGTRGLPYAAIHEYGGNIPDRYPVNARALSWISPQGGRVFAMKAKGFRMPERSYMRSSLADLTPEITTRMQTAMQRLLDE